MKLPEYIAGLAHHPDFKDAFVYHRHVSPRRASYGAGPGLHPSVSQLLRDQGLERLYSHQAEAMECMKARRNVLVATPTASGKSLVYNASVLDRVCEDPGVRALYVFPLKALAQDQLKTLSSWLGRLKQSGVSAGIYDGDTTPYQRKKIRTRPPHILITNPDMLHRGILAHHESWQEFFTRLEVVVLDEVHAYRGIFGSHVNQIIRRLKRVCGIYGTRPRFVLLSATVSNPGQFGERLIGEDLHVVEATGAPRAGQHFVFMNPEGSPNFLAAKLFTHCIGNGFRTIAFTQARKVTELMHVWVSQLAPRFASKISSYRAGFLPGERRRIEKGLATGSLLGVISTSALEMGIDIGYLDVCLLVGYPGTVINTWQRGGRVGRSGRESLVVLLAKPDALDQYFMKNPGDLFDRPYEAAVLDPDNPFVVDAHLPCAAAEMPLTLGDGRYWPYELEARLDGLESSGALLRSADGEPTWFSARRNPHLHVDVRTAGETFTIFEKETGQAIGTVDGVRALKECHPGAVYLHRARHYLVDELILEKRDIIAHQAPVKYFTRIRSEKETDILGVRRSRPRRQFLVREGDLKVTEEITGYEKRALPGQELMGVFPLDLPRQTFETVGFWVEIEPAVKDYVERQGLHFMGGIHAVEHAAIGIFPLFALCDRNDIGGICYPHHHQVGKSAIFIYDAYPGGVGLASRGFEIVEDLLEKTLELVSGCGCEAGCPSCIHSPKCGSGNKPLDKGAAVSVLQGLLGYISLGSISPAAGAPAEHPLPAPEEDEEDSRFRPRIVYMDLETRKLAQEVGGWGNSHLMQISVAVVYDSLAEEFFVFEEDDTEGLIERLERADLVVGFNIKRFDYRVLGAYTNRDLGSLPTFDILEDIYKRLGFRIGLDHLACETLSTRKTADGLQAVEWFRQGEMKKLTDYCRADVAVTRDLFNYGLREGHLVYREKSTDTRVRLPVQWNLEEILNGVTG